MPLSQACTPLLQVNSGGDRVSSKDPSALIMVTLQGTVPGVNDLGVYAQGANEYKMEHLDLRTQRPPSLCQHLPFVLLAPQQCLIQIKAYVLPRRDY
jgi:hypothetical protein